MKLPGQFGLVLLGFDAASRRALGHSTEVYGELSEKGGSDDEVQHD